jgi:hypothetical protein
MADVLDLVRKLLRLSASSNPHEAAAAAAKAQSLIDEHNLQDALLAVDAHQEATADAEPIYDFGTKGAPLDARGERVATWRLTLASTIARANSCKVYYQGGSIHLIGRPSDANTVRYLFGYIAEQVERLTKEHGAGCGRTWCNNFRLGCVDTIRLKLNAQREAFRREARTVQSFIEGGSTQALVRVNQALALIDKRAERTADWVKANMKLRTVSSAGSTYNPSAREAGRKAGRSIAINSARGSLVSGAKALTN